MDWLLVRECGCYYLATLLSGLIPGMAVAYPEPVPPVGRRPALAAPTLRERPDPLVRRQRGVEAGEFDICRSALHARAE